MHCLSATSDQHADATSLAGTKATCAVGGWHGRQTSKREIFLPLLHPQKAQERSRRGPAAVRLAVSESWLVARPSRCQYGASWTLRLARGTFQRSLAPVRSWGSCRWRSRRESGVLHHRTPRLPAQHYAIRRLPAPTEQRMYKPQG